MFVSIALVAALATLQSAQVAPPASGVSITQQRDAVNKSEKIMAEAQKRPGLLAQYLYMRDADATDQKVSFRLIFNQYLSWYQTWIGDYAGARTSFSIVESAKRGDSLSPLAGGYKAVPAVAAISDLAKGQKAIFLNESHSIPLTRTVTVELLARLRAEGFNTFAAETLYESDKDLAKRGYPIDGSGFYTEEPVYAEMVRSALKLGYRVVAYEALSNAIGDAREREQARNLYNAAIKGHPDARLVVNAGFAHIQESGVYFGGKSMAQHFKLLSDINPLTVEQTMLIPHPNADGDHPIYKDVIAKLHPDTPIVFRDDAGKPWSLRSKEYDVSVFFPTDHWQHGRPTWLELGGMRTSYPVYGTICAGKYPCLIEARYANEGDDAIPADRLVFDPTGPSATNRDRVVTSSDATPASDLYLRPGKYRLVARDTSNQVIARQNITVTEGDKR